MKPSRGWEGSKKHYLRFRRAAYGLVDNPSLWKLTIDSRLYKKSFRSILGFQQVFVFCNASGSAVNVVLTKVVDGILMTLEDTHGQQLIESMNQLFSLGRIITDKNMIFNKLHISQHEKKDIYFSMKYALSSIK